MDVPVWHYDGSNARRWHCRLAGDGQGFHLIAREWESGPWRWEDLTAQDKSGSDAVFGHREKEGWRIGFSGAVPADILPLLPRGQRYGGIIDRIGLGKASIAFAALAAAAILVGVKAPAWVAPFVPQSWEDRLGDAMVGDFGGRYCHTPQGDAALKALVARMDPEGHARSVEIANIPMVNAIALPGRRVILFDGFIQSAESPDEIAGVLGHEMGHVHHRHTLTALMRQMGLSVILGGMDGNIGANIGSLMGLSFSRGAEHEADEAAISALERANVSPQGAARFFERMGRKQEDDAKGSDKATDSQAKDAPRKADGGKADGKADGGKEAAGGKDRGGEDSAIEQAGNWFATHPTSASRHRFFADAVKKGHAYQPALSPAQWQALRSMCAQDKNVERSKGFPF